MALALRDPSEAFWVTDEDLAATSRATDIVPDPEVAYCVRPCPEAVQREIRKGLVEYVFDRKSHQKVERPFTPEEQSELAARVFGYVLTDWRGIVDATTGQPVPCETAQKRAFWDSDKPRVLALFQIVNTLGSAASEARGPESFRRPEGVGAVVG